MGARHNRYFRKLLVGFDASPQAEKAVEVAMQLSQCLDAEIVLFAVAWLPKPATRVEVHAILDDAREHYTAAFEKLASSAKDHGLNMKTEIVVGDPAGQIIHRTEAGGIDMVLLGHRRR
jgi:nucleotide-binding universal stress UspA family protein